MENEEGREETLKATRGVDDAVHELHVLYMRYFSLDDPWQPTTNRCEERAMLLERMAIVVDEIMNAEERPPWLHPAMFRGPLASALCSLPPNPDHSAILMPPAPDPQEVYWSKFSICNHSRPLESSPFVMSMHYYPPHNSQKSRNPPASLSPATTSGISSPPSGSKDPAQATSGSESFPVSSLPRVGALPNNKFRDAKQIQIERFVGRILYARGLQFNRTNDRSKPQAFLYQIPSNE